MNRKRWLSVGLAIVLGCLLGHLGFSLWGAPSARVERVAWSPTVQWIGPQTPSYRFYARRTIDLPTQPQVAWMRWSADNDFILYVNGQVVSRELSVLYNSIGLGARLTDSFQVWNIRRVLESSQYFNDRLPYRWLLPEFLNLSNAKDWKITPYVDLTPFLKPGKNVIALQVQKGRKDPRLAVEGSILTTPEATPIDLSTGSSLWQTASLFQSHQEIPWFDPAFPAENWVPSPVVGSVQEATYSRLSQHLFDQPLLGEWITANGRPSRDAWLQQTWQVPDRFQRAFIRLAGKGEYALLMNGQLVRRFESETGNQMYLYEVTNFLKPGDNQLTVRLANPLTGDPFVPGVTLPKIVLDGWVEDQGQVTAAIATDSSWRTVSSTALKMPTDEPGQAVAVLGPPASDAFIRTFMGNAYLLNYSNYLVRKVAWIFVGVVGAGGLSWLLGWLWLANRRSVWEQFTDGTALLVPGTFFLIGVYLLEHRYADGEEGLLFVQSQSNTLILLGFLSVVLLTLLAHQVSQLAALSRSSSNIWVRWFLTTVGLGVTACFGFKLLGDMAIAYPPVLGLAVMGLAIGASFLLVPILKQDVSLRLFTLLRARSRWIFWLLLVLIVVIGLALRLYQLGATGLEADENTSLDAIRGILRTGAPITTAGIWYTRSPAYHYLAAVWLWCLGDTSTNARLLSVVWGTATLILAFCFTRKITQNIWIALIVTALLAVDPWEIWYSRSVRFYQIVQFSTILTLWWFLKGFVEARSRLYQYLFFVALTWTLLNQEGMVILLPAFLLGFLYFYRPFRLVEDWGIVAAAIVSGGILYYDLLFVKIKTLTPWVAISTTTDSLLRLHLPSYITLFFANFFVGPSRMRIILSIFFFIGFLLFLKWSNAKILFLFSTVLLTLVAITLLIVPLANRYAYPVYPIFIALAVYSAVSVIDVVGQIFSESLAGVVPLRMISFGFAGLLLITNLELGRVLASYGDAIVFRSTEVSEYIRDHRQPGDVVISAFPAAHANTIGRPDYVVPYRTSIFDAVYEKDGQLRDRWDGGVILNSIEAMNQVLQKSNRVWIHGFDRLDQPLPIDPELSEFRNYLQVVGQPVMETFGTRLRLWQKKDGILPRIPSEGKDLGNY